MISSNVNTLDKAKPSKHYYTNNFKLIDPLKCPQGLLGVYKPHFEKLHFNKSSFLNKNTHCDPKSIFQNSEKFLLVKYTSTEA